MSNPEIAAECYAYYIDKEDQKDSLDDFLEFTKTFGLENYRILAMEIV